MQITNFLHLENCNPFKCNLFVLQLKALARMRPAKRITATNLEVHGDIFVVITLFFASSSGEELQTPHISNYLHQSKFLRVQWWISVAAA